MKMPIKLNLDTTMQQEVGDELIVYQKIGGKVHHLEPVSASVYKACDGVSDFSSVASRLTEGDEERLRLILEQLSQAQLIEAVEKTTSTRRTFLQTAGKAAALVPLVTTVMMPDPVSAQSTCVAGGNSGCVAQPQTSGTSGMGPNGCVACDDDAAGNSCATTTCAYQYSCRDSGGNLVPCDSMAPNICEAGTNDLPAATACAANGGVFSNYRPNCSDAKQAAASGGNSFYTCCSCM